MQITVLCKVVDNFGDIGVVYRLSKQLKKLNPANQINLVTDNLQSFNKICSNVKCGQPITEIASAIADKNSGEPIHFDCALNEVKQAEPTGENEKIAYIGQGRFAVLSYENIRDQRHFTIKKIIEWESREQQSQWREELSGLYSKIN